MKNWKRITLFIVSLAVAVGLTLFLWDIFETIQTETGREEFKTTILDAGPVGCLMLIGLNVAQIFLFFLPGEPIELLAGMCYGTIGGLLVIYAGIILSSILIFFLIRKVGKASDLIGESKLERIKNSRFLKSGNAERVLLLLFILPGTPKDLLVYMGALMPTKASRFIILSTLLRFPSIITSTIAGESFAEGDNHFAIFVYAITIVASLLIMWYFAKKDDVKEIMEINKG